MTAFIWLVVVVQLLGFVGRLICLATVKRWPVSVTRGAGSLAFNAFLSVVVAAWGLYLLLT